MNQLFKYIHIAVLAGLVSSMAPVELSAKKCCNIETEHYDYIVIGSCAGAVTAKRLSDDKKTSVLLLEMGDDNNTNPLLVDSSFGLTAATILDPEIDYQGVSTMQEDVDFARYAFATGRLLGGASSHNGLQVVFGTADYWQKVADIVGDDWSVNKVFARYKALETYKNDGPEPVSPTRGTRGPWKNVSAPSTLTPDAEYLLDALVGSSGLPVIDDYNTPGESIGPFARWDYQEQFDKEYIRESAAFAFLGPKVVDEEGHGVYGRKLTLKVRAPAMKLLWDKNDPTKVTGVRYTRDGKVIDACAKKEVIVACGMFSAPFLQLSGIGPQDVLENAGVEPRIINDHVGRHLQNHITAFAFFATPQAQLPTPSEPWAIWLPSAFLPGESTSERTYQYIAVDGTGLGAPGTLAIIAILVTPKSEGTIFIQDNDFTKIPLWDPNYLSDPADLDALIYTFQTDILALDDYFAANPSPENTNWFLAIPPRSVVEDTAQLEALARASLGQAVHYTSQTRMGPDSSTSVCDSRGRVHGVKNLRVADVSILPMVPDGNTCTPAILCGWTIAEFILEEQDSSCTR